MKFSKCQEKRKVFLIFAAQQTTFTCLSPHNAHSNIAHHLEYRLNYLEFMLFCFRTRVSFKYGIFILYTSESVVENHKIPLWNFRCQARVAVTSSLAGTKYARAMAWKNSNETSSRIKTEGRQMDMKNRRWMKILLNFKVGREILKVKDLNFKLQLKVFMKNVKSKPRNSTNYGSSP